MTNSTESLISYDGDVGITDVLQYLKITSPKGEEDVKIDLVYDTTLIYTHN